MCCLVRAIAHIVGGDKVAWRNFGMLISEKPALLPLRRSGISTEVNAELGPGLRAEMPVAIPPELQNKIDAVLRVTNTSFYHIIFL
jgi:hypothetical protein